MRSALRGTRIADPTLHQVVRVTYVGDGIPAKRRAGMLGGSDPMILA